MTARTRQPRTTRSAKLDPHTDAAFGIGCGWSWYSKAELADLRQLWIEVGDDYMAQRVARLGPEFGSNCWALMEFGTPAACVAEDAAKAAKKAKA